MSQVMPTHPIAATTVSASAPRPFFGANRDLFVGAVYGILAALIWGAWPVVSRLGVLAAEPGAVALTAWDIAALRFAVAGLLLAPVVIRRGVAGVGWLGAGVMAVGAGVPYIVVVVSGLGMAPAGHAGIIVPSCMLTFTMAGAWWLLGDRPAPARLVGFAVILAGVALIGAAGWNQGAVDAWAGQVLFVLGGLLWASYTVAAKAWRADPLHATALVSVLSAALYLPVYVFAGEPRVFSAPMDQVAFQAMFQGVGAGIGALLFYTKAVALLGAARGAVFAALVPGVAVLLAMPLLGEAPGMVEVAGLAVVTGGMLVALGLVGRRNIGN